MDFIHIHISSSTFVILFFLTILGIPYIIRFFQNGYIEQIFIVEENDELYAYILSSYSITTVLSLLLLSKGAYNFLCTYKFQKFNLKTQKFVYEVFVPSFFIEGLTKEFAFGDFTKRKFSTIDLKTGKVKYFSKNKIQKNNPNFNASIKKADYSKEANRIIIYDDLDYKYFFNHKTLKVTKYDKEFDDTNNQLNYAILNDLPRAIIEKNRFKRNCLFNDTPKYEIKAIPDDNSNVCSIIFIKSPDTKEKEKIELNKAVDKFISPYYINNGTGRFPFYTETPPTILIAHTISPKSKLKDIYISLVGQSSKEIWRIPFLEVARWRNFYYYDFNEKIYIISLVNLSYSLSNFRRTRVKLSIIDKKTGKIIKKAKKFNNKVFKN